MGINRREFLAGAVGTGALLATTTLRAAPATRPVDPCEVVALGKSGLKVTRIGIGTGMHGGNRSSNQKRLGKDACVALIKSAWDRGIRLFDMADIYGTHEELAIALKGVPREQYAIISKIWVRPGTLPEKERPDANIVIDRFRKELNTEYIDLVQIHCMTAANWTEEQKKQMDIMAGLKSKGIIRAHGVSCHSIPALKAAIESPWVDVVHARINPTGAAMDGKPEEVSPLLAKLHDAGKGVIGMKIVGEGRYRDGEQRSESIRYVLGLGSVDAMVVGFENKAQVEDFETRVKDELIQKRL